MSLRILGKNVCAVLLPDGWHDVDDGIFFDTVEITDTDGKEYRVPKGFVFGAGDGTFINGPVTSILAMRDFGDYGDDLPPIASKATKADE